ncbi:MAG: hypothetical protein HYS41_06075 [Candidatus Omnitrophica bacterium]|nr:hypothetical protein [Candidatus Omnitrophota bacterium]
MSVQHRDLAAGRWDQLPFLTQMAHVGGEVERALNWQAKNNASYGRQAAERALELMDFMLDGVREGARLKELARAREVLADYFFGANGYGSTPLSLRRYFSFFSCAARKND